MIDRRKTTRPPLTDSRLRIGAVNYLNSKPLIEDLAELAPEAEIHCDYPSRLADDLAAGRLDVALIPSVEALADPDYEIVSDACVAARGPAMSVKLYFRVPPGEVQTLALDEGSRTSAALARIILAERHGVEPRVSPLPLGSNVSETLTDAVLLIGDRAMHAPDETFVCEWDLGDEWYRWSGLPFVFAMWVTREGVDLGGIEEALAAARDRGVAQLEEIAEREAPRLGLTGGTAFHYLSRNLHFQLGSAERSGLKLFHRLAAALGLAPAETLPRFRRALDSPASRRLEPATA